MIEIIYETICSLRNQKWHVVVTGFAMLWSVFLLIFMLGSGNGVMHAVKTSMGIDTLSIFSIRPGITQFAFEGYESKREIELKFSDVEKLSQYLGPSATSVEAMSIGPIVEIVHENRHIGMPICGITKNFLITHNCHIWKGTNINDMNDINRDHVCLINFHTAETLFSGSPDPVNKMININGMPFRVIGIYGFAFDAPIENLIYVPMSTANDLFNHDDKVSMMYVLCSQNIHKEKQSDAFAQSIHLWFSNRYHFAPDDHSALTCKNMSIHAMRLQYSLRLLSRFIWFICLAALLVGITGISNIMLIMVNDRIPEIGIRRILGASNFNIIGQVLLESILITTFFGYIGIFLAIMLLKCLSWYLTNFLNLPYFKNPTVDIASILITFVILVVCGLIAGVYPAIKAVRMKPVESIYA